MGAQKNYFLCLKEANGPLLSMECWRMPPLTFYLPFTCTLLYLLLLVLFWFVVFFFNSSNLSAMSRIKGKAAWRAPVVGSDELPALLPSYPLTNHTSHMPWSGSLDIWWVSVVHTLDGNTRVQCISVRVQNALETKGWAAYLQLILTVVQEAPLLLELFLLEKL